MTQSLPLSSLETSSSAKFPDVGTKYVGRITGIDQRPQTDLEGKPKFFPSGDPMMLWVITIEDERGETVALWAKGGNYKAASGTGQSMQNAIAQAIRDAKADSITVGGQLGVAHTGLSDAKPGMNPAKLFTAQYQPPAAPSVPADLFSQ
jgi:hypothetical protein